MSQWLAPQPIKQFVYNTRAYTRAFIVAILTFYTAHPTPKVKNHTGGMSGMSGLFFKFPY